MFVTTQYALDDVMAAGAQFEKINGWEAAVKDQAAEAEEQNGNPESSAKSGGRWNRAAVDGEVRLQRQRVIDGVAHAEGFDELNVLRQRAHALRLDREVKKCDERLKVFHAAREARNGSMDAGQPGARPRNSSGSSHMGSAAYSTGGSPAPRGPAGQTNSSDPTVQFQ